jgi:hypothetical protein
MFWTKYLNILVKFVWKVCFRLVFNMSSVCHVFSYILAFHVRQTCRVQFGQNLMFWTKYLNILAKFNRKPFFLMLFIMCRVCHVFSYTSAFCVQQTCGVRFDRNLMFWTEYLNILFQIVRIHNSNSCSWRVSCVMLLSLYCVLFVFHNHARWLLQNIMFCSKYLNIWTQIVKPNTLSGCCMNVVLSYVSFSHFYPWKSNV